MEGLKMKIQIIDNWYTNLRKGQIINNVKKIEGSEIDCYEYANTHVVNGNHCKEV